MIRTLIASAALACAALAVPAHATTVLDTGTPGGNSLDALVLDGSDWYAAEVDITSAARIGAVSAHLLGGYSGETYHFSLYADDGLGEPGTQLATATAVFGTDGWNGVSGLSGWTVQAGKYWVGVEVSDTDTLGSASATGALLDLGAASPANTAFSTYGSLGYSADGADSFGLRVSTVPENGAAALMLAGLGLVAGAARRRRA